MMIAALRDRVTHRCHIPETGSRLKAESAKAARRKKGDKRDLDPGMN